MTRSMSTCMIRSVSGVYGLFEETASGKIALKTVDLTPGNYMAELFPNVVSIVLYSWRRRLSRLIRKRWTH